MLMTHKPENLHLLKERNLCFDLVFPELLRWVPIRDYLWDTYYGVCGVKDKKELLLMRPL